MEIRKNYDSQSNCVKKENREDYNKILARQSALTIDQAEWIKESLSSKYNRSFR